MTATSISAPSAHMRSRHRSAVLYCLVRAAISTKQNACLYVCPSAAIGCEAVGHPAGEMSLSGTPSGPARIPSG